MEITWEFVFNAGPESIYRRANFDFYYLRTHPYSEKFEAILRQKGSIWFSDTRETIEMEPRGWGEWPRALAEELFKLSIKNDFPIFKYFSYYGDRIFRKSFFASKIVAPWVKGEDGEFFQKVPEQDCFPGTLFFSAALPLPFVYNENCLLVTATRGFHRDSGWWRPCNFFEAKDLLHSYHCGYRIIYKPSNRFGMRFGAYPKESNRAIAIERTLAEVKLAIDRRVGNLPKEKGAAVLGGKSSGLRPYDAVLGGLGGTTPGPTLTPSPTPPTQKQTASMPRDWGDVDDFVEILEDD